MIEITPSLMPDVLNQFRAGDERAFLEIYRDCASDVRLWVSNFFCSPFDHEEAVQEAWLTVHRMRCSYDPDKGPLRPWLKALTFNRCREILRARGRRPHAEIEPDESLECAAQRPDEYVLLSRLRQAVAQFAASLAVEERQALLALLNESSNQETAQLLAVNIRRCKYLKQKIIVRATKDRHLRDASSDFLGYN